MLCRFLDRALIGVCTAWDLSDVLNGVTTHFVFSIVALGIVLTSRPSIVTLGVCRVMTTSCLHSRSSHDKETTTPTIRHEIMII
jgi:hypothetical protein